MRAIVHQELWLLHENAIRIDEVNTFYPTQSAKDFYRGVPNFVVKKALDSASAALLLLTEQ